MVLRRRSRAAVRAAARLAAVLLPAIAVLHGCSATLENRWKDPEFGCDVQTDFERSQVELMMRDIALPRVRALCALFEVESLEGLTISVHDEAAVDVGSGFHVQGWHGRGEIHLMASWAGTRLTMPTPESLRVLEHELAHALFERTHVAPPRWMEEGLCEVLSASPLGSDGRLVAMPDGPRERRARELRAAGRWLTAAQLLALRDRYPEDPVELAPMYAQGSSLAYALLRRRPAPTRAVLAELAALPQSVLEREYSDWELALATTSTAALLAPFVSSADPAVRTAAAGELGERTDDEAWWRAAASLLADPDPRVRTDMRLGAVYRPSRTVADRERYRAWRDGADAQLRLAGLAALAQCGDLPAAIAFGRGVAAVGGADWWQPLLWIAGIVPGEDGGRRAWPEVERSSDAAYVASYGAELAESIERLGPRLAWDAAKGAYRLTSDSAPTRDR